MGASDRAYGEDIGGIASEKALKGQTVSYYVEYDLVEPTRGDGTTKADILPDSRRRKRCRTAHRSSMTLSLLQTNRLLRPSSVSAIVRLVRHLLKEIGQWTKANRIAALKSMLIVPRTPSPPPLEEREYKTLTEDEKMELCNRARERKVSGISRNQSRLLMLS
jgi:hypothetical protein